MHRLFTTLRFRLILLVFLAVLPALGVILYSGLEQRRMAVDEAQKDVLDLVIHISVYQDDGEFGQLAQSFDEMAATLQQRQERLRESEEKYRTLVEQLPAIIFTHSPG